MIFNLEGIEEQLRETVKTSLQSIINQLSNKLDLTLVEQIIVPDNFIQSIDRTTSKSIQNLNTN